MATVAINDITVRTYFSRWERVSRERAELMDAEAGQMTELVEKQAELLNDYLVTPAGSKKVVELDSDTLRTVIADAPDEQKQDLMVALRSLLLSAVEEDELLDSLPSALEA